MWKRSSRPQPFRIRASLVLWIGVLGPVAFFPSASRADFLQSLFGLAPVETASAPLTVRPHRVPSRRRQAARRQARERLDAPSEVKVGRQKVVGILEDPTLRDGDVLMATDGIRIFVGPASAVHDVDQFVPLNAARHLAPAARGRLAALDVTASLRARIDTRRRRSWRPHDRPVSIGAGKPMRFVGP